jgi:hypothetical protein
VSSSTAPPARSWPPISTATAPVGGACVSRSSNAWRPACCVSLTGALTALGAGAEPEPHARQSLTAHAGATAAANPSRIGSLSPLQPKGRKRWFEQPISASMRLKATSFQATGIETAPRKMTPSPPRHGCRRHGTSRSASYFLQERRRVFFLQSHPVRLGSICSSIRDTVVVTEERRRPLWKSMPRSGVSTRFQCNQRTSPGSMRWAMTWLSPAIGCIGCAGPRCESWASARV